MTDPNRTSNEHNNAPAVPQGEPVNELVRLCPDIECARKKKCTRIPGISCMSRAKENY